MAHLEQMIYCSKIKALFRDHFYKKNVLDIGSLDVNGTNRPLFNSCNYTGLDLAVGPNVTHVYPGHLWNASNDTYDVIISTECGEHDKHYIDTITNSIRMLKSGGLFYIYLRNKR